jgi:hypothetical protein
MHTFYAQRTKWLIHNAKINNAVQNAVARLRTDFDAFTTKEWSALFSQGYAAARRSLAFLAPAEPTVAEPYRPWQNDAFDWDDEKTALELSKGQVRRAHLFTKMDHYSLAGALLLLIAMLGACFGWAPIVLQCQKIVTAVIDRAHSSFGDRQIELREPQIAGPEAELAGITLSAEARQQIALAVAAYRSDADKTPASREALLLIQKAPFESGYGSFHRKFKFSGNARVEDGECMLVDTRPRKDSVGVRVLHMEQEPTRSYEPTGLVEFDGPRAGELFVAIIEVEPLSPDDKEPFPKRNLSLYGITLEYQ